MCFSPEADLVMGSVIGVVAIDVFTHHPARRDLLLASVVPLLAVHSLVETFVWWAGRGLVSESIGAAAAHVYLLIAFVVLPVLLPLAVRAHETVPERRRLMTGLVVVGVFVSSSLLWSLGSGSVTATLHHHFVSYAIGVHAPDVVVPLYVLATCGAALLASSRHLVVFGVLNLLVVTGLAWVTSAGLTSLWCGWAALTSVAIALLVRRVEPARQLTT